MSVSSVSTSSPPPSPPPVSTETNKQQTQQTQQAEKPAFKPEKTGDEAAAEKQASRPPLPPGQGTRVDIIA
ncbi:hypothetical protein SSBR45G_45860 [Bradyrhizobium sp. SSBR45G]|uniref:hypothetical protein n=1 Tax=unclassified Bradyrhizobium TaxID=2631580 RepID=UPI002342A350|nr:MULTISPECIES: hypothetical protein [unclassified Bradyrhizobium]GLH79677.1 hypothetical protein SSBR45G_45860 [Bradyrhizobium sp. SSBR45G]GLH86928.1 hypothetical protein SSBR45R_43880 [Bradyrhizobium sp. SSBR45R]